MWTVHLLLYTAGVLATLAPAGPDEALVVRHLSRHDVHAMHDRAVWGANKSQRKRDLPNGTKSPKCSRKKSGQFGGSPATNTPPVASATPASFGDPPPKHDSLTQLPDGLPATPSATPVATTRPPGGDGLGRGDATTTIGGNATSAGGSNAEPGTSSNPSGDIRTLPKNKNPCQKQLLIDCPNFKIPDEPVYDIRKILDVINQKARPNWRFGMFYGHWPASDQAAANARLTDTFNIATISNDCKWFATEPNQGRPNYANCKGQVEILKQHNVDWHAHALFYPGISPSWVKSLSAEQFTTVMADHVKGFLGVGKAYSTDVFNEIMGGGGNTAVECVAGKHEFPMNGPFKDLSWAVDIVKQAKAVGTGGILMINDYNTGLNGARDHCMEMTFSYLKPFGLDCIGYQLHVGADQNGYVPKDVLAATFERVHALGGLTAITELDVAVPVNAGEADYRKQAEIYGDYVQVCLESPACTQWINGGLVDKDSWLNEKGNRHPLLLDEQLKPKLAYWEIRARLLQFANSL